MFYAPEILSFKNRTELSLVYYMSTARNTRKLARKDVVSLDVVSLIEQIQSPKVPFALRLYSYLLKGLVKIWIMKVEFYKDKVQSLFVRPMRRVVKKTAGEINLRIIEDTNYIDENFSWEGEIPPIFDQEGVFYGDDKGRGYKEDYTGYGNKEQPEVHPTDHFNENYCDFFNSNNASSFEPLPLKSKEKIDRSIEASAESIWIKRVRTASVEYESLVSRDVLGLLGKRGIPEGAGADFDTVSIEDPRISSSVSQERNGERGRNEREGAEEETIAMWFYGVLVAATRGEIRVYQEEPFGEIVVV